MKKKKTYNAEFKTRVVLEILKEEDSLSSIASKYEITVQTLRKWKKQFLENASLAFDLNNATKEYKEKIEKLEKENDIKLMKRVDDIYSEISVYGYRRIHKQLKAEGFKVGHNKVHRLMKIMNIHGLRPKRRKVNLKKENNKIYPYLLKDLEIKRPNQVWCSDITYIPVKSGYMYLCVVMDRYSKSVLSWNISNTMDSDLVLKTTQEAIEKFGRPEIFNSDQGIKEYINFYNYKRFHSGLNYDKPMNVYQKMLHKVA